MCTGGSQKRIDGPHSAKYSLYQQNAFEPWHYYVSSRYYDPEIGRFINADNVIAGAGRSVQG